MIRVLACLCLLSGCISVRAISVDKKSTLEQQFIGEYEELTEDLQTVASVRATANGLGANGDDPYARALQARRVQLFYKDDLDRARSRGCVGEALDGRLALLKCSEAPASQPSSAPALEPVTARLVQIENDARGALVEYALSKNTSLKDGDRQLVWQAYRRIVLTALKKGDLVQNNAGEWIGHAK
jgi:uncharacterized protein YdbL (DUF1318 family)